MKRLKTILYPIKLPGNISFDIKKAYLEESGFEVYSFREGIKRIWQIDLINYNFFEIIHSQNGLVCIAKYLTKKLVISLTRLFGLKIVYTIHNKQGHDSRYPKFDISLMKTLLKASDGIVVLCDETRSYIEDLFGKTLYNTIENKIVKIPLVSYEGAYPECDTNFREIWNISQDEMVIMFLGGISRYKNIEFIIRYVNETKHEGVRFVLAGNGRKEYVDELEEKLDTELKEKILFLPTYVKNEEIEGFVRACDLFLIPLNQNSSLNSGSCELAFSHHRNVVCPEVGTIKELPSGLCYSYEYNTEDEHYEHMKATLDYAISEFKSNRASFVEKQEKLYEFTKENNAVEIIREKYAELYLRLCDSRR